MLSVVALGALCELSPRESGSVPGVDVGISEFADLNDGRRMIWKEDRGWSTSTEYSPWPVDNGRDLTFEAMMVTDTENHRLNSYIEWALEGLRDMGLDVDPASVYCAPFRVECGPRLEAEMGRAAQLFNPSERLRNRSQLDPTVYRGGDRATTVYADSEQPRSSSAHSSAHASDSGDSVDGVEDRARLYLEMPRALIERLVDFCRDQQVTPSAVVQRLVEEYLQDSRC